MVGLLPVEYITPVPFSISEARSVQESVVSSFVVPEELETVGISFTQVTVTNPVAVAHPGIQSES